MQLIDTINIEAVIFDIDGTMVDNMPTHKEAWREFCTRKGIVLSDADFKQKVSGFKNDQIFVNLFGKNISKKDVDIYAEEKESVYRELYRQKITEVSGLTELIQKIKDLKIRLAIATTAPLKNRTFILKELHLDNAFEVILGEEDVKKGKPDPEIYLKTAELLKVKPEYCLVFEDSPPGVESGKRAGMKVVGITTSHSKKDLSNADWVVQDFSELKLK